MAVVIQDQPPINKDGIDYRWIGYGQPIPYLILTTSIASPNPADNRLEVFVIRQGGETIATLEYTLPFGENTIDISGAFQGALNTEVDTEQFPTGIEHDNMFADFTVTFRQRDSVTGEPLTPVAISEVITVTFARTQINEQPILEPYVPIGQQNLPPLKNALFLQRFEQATLWSRESRQTGAFTIMPSMISMLIADETTGVIGGSNDIILSFQAVDINGNDITLGSITNLVFIKDFGANDNKLISAIPRAVPINVAIDQIAFIDCTVTWATFTFIERRRFKHRHLGKLDFIGDLEDCPIFAVHWLNSVGGFNTWYFTFQHQITIRNDPGDIYQVAVLDALRADKSVGKRASDFVDVWECYADDLELQELRALAELKSSPEVFVLTIPGVKLSVIVLDVTTGYNTRSKLYSFTVRVQFPPNVDSKRWFREAVPPDRDFLTLNFALPGELSI